MISPLVLGWLAAAAAPAQAFSLSPAAEATLEHGRPYVEIHPQGAEGVMDAAIDIAAPPQVVFAVIADCDLAPKMVESLKSCRVLDRDPAGRWDVREEISKMTFMPSVRNVYRSDYDPPRSVRFHRVDGDLRVFEGEWRIEPHGASVRVFYENRVSAALHVPGPVVRAALRIEVPRALLALRREAQARAQ